MNIELTSNEQTLLNQYSQAIESLNKDKNMLSLALDNMFRLIIERAGGDPVNKSYVLSEDRKSIKEVEDGVAQ